MRRRRENGERMDHGIGKAGMVYILSNPAMPGLVKIGRTGRPLQTRLNEINSATGVPLPYRIEAYVAAADARAVEAATHAALASRRVNGRREFFRTDVATALLAARSAARSRGGRFRRCRGARAPSTLPSPMSAAVTTLAALPGVHLIHPLLPAPWLAICLFASLFGRPRALAEFLDMGGDGGPLPHLAVAAAGVFLAVVAIWYGQDLQDLDPSRWLPMTFHTGPS